MLDRVREILTMYANKPAFRERVREHFGTSRKELMLIIRALYYASDGHKDQFRLDGNTVLQQPLAVATLLMEYLGVRDAKTISVALLHLFIEDLPPWNFSRLMRIFGPEIALGVWFVSKPTAQDERHWKLRTTLSHLKLRLAPKNLQILKLCDRFHNLLSITALPSWKQERMLRDTIEFYVPLSRRCGVLTEELLEAVKLASRAS